MVTSRKSWTSDLKVDVPEGSSGPWTIERYEFLADDPEHNFFNFRMTASGYPDRCIPPGWYTKLEHDERGVVMSDTPAEVKDHREMIWRLQSPTTKRVLIMGLGLGMILGYALKLEHVEHVDVVEIDHDVIGLVASHYEAMAERLGKSLTITHESAYDVEWPTGSRWDVVWHDIWDDINPDHLPKMTQLKRKYAKRAGWQACWGEDVIRHRTGRFLG